MKELNEYLATDPFDLYELHLFHLVVKHGSFTRAAEVAGLTQSAVTRQIQAMESSLGLNLLERTTRKVGLTPAGDYLYGESVRLLGDVDATLVRLREEFGGAPKKIRVGVSNSVGLGYLPGFFHAFVKKNPAITVRVSAIKGEDVATQLQANELDLGVTTSGRRLPRNLQATHEFQDLFCLIAPAKPATDSIQALDIQGFERWSQEQNWLLIEDASKVGQALRVWMKGIGWKSKAVAELDSFDWIVNLVALGTGVAFVPVRALSPYRRPHAIKRISLPVRFQRVLQVISRSQANRPAHLSQFLENILF